MKQEQDREEGSWVSMLMAICFLVTFTAVTISKTQNMDNKEQCGHCCYFQKKYEDIEGWAPCTLEENHGKYGTRRCDFPACVKFKERKEERGKYEKK